MPPWIFGHRFWQVGSGPVVEACGFFPKGLQALVCCRIPAVIQAEFIKGIAKEFYLGLGGFLPAGSQFAKEFGRNK